MRRLSLPPIPALVVAMISIQGGSVIAKTLFPAVGFFGATTLRVSLAALVLLAVLRPDLRRLNAPQWQVILPYGAVLGIMNLSFYASLHYLPLGMAVTLEFIGPLALSLALSHRALDVGWVALAATGIFLIVPHGDSTGGLHLLGVLLALFAGACWAAYILLGGAVGRRVPGNTGVVAGMIIAAVITLPFGMAQAGVSLLRPEALMAGIGLAVLSSALPYTLELNALRHVPPRIFGVLMSLEPAIAALIGLIFLHEQLTALQWLALLCVVAASAGISLTGKPQAHTEPEPIN